MSPNAPTLRATGVTIPLAAAGIHLALPTESRLRTTASDPRIRAVPSAVAGKKYPAPCSGASRTRSARLEPFDCAVAIDDA